MSQSMTSGAIREQTVHGVTTTLTLYNLIIVLEAVWLSFRAKEAFFPCCSSRSHNFNCTFASRARLQHGGHFGEHSAQYQISVNCVNSEESLWTLRLCLGQLTPWMTLLFGFTNFWAISQQILGVICAFRYCLTRIFIHPDTTGFSVYYVFCLIHLDLLDPTRFSDLFAKPASTHLHIRLKHYV